MIKYLVLALLTTTPVAAKCFVLCGSTTAGSSFSRDPTHNNTATWNGKFGKEAYAIHTDNAGLPENRGFDQSTNAGIDATHRAKAGADNGLGGKGVAAHDASNTGGNTGASSDR